MIVLTIAPGTPAALLRSLQRALGRFPGRHPVVVLSGDRRLSLGHGFDSDASPACVASLSEFGQVTVSPD